MITTVLPQLHLFLDCSADKKRAKNNTQIGFLSLRYFNDRARSFNALLAYTEHTLG